MNNKKHSLQFVNGVSGVGQVVAQVVEKVLGQPQELSSENHQTLPAQVLTVMYFIRTKVFNTLYNKF